MTSKSISILTAIATMIGVLTTMYAATATFLRSAKQTAWASLKLN